MVRSYRVLPDHGRKESRTGPGWEPALPPRAHPFRLRNRFGASTEDSDDEYDYHPTNHPRHYRHDTPSVRQMVATAARVAYFRKKFSDRIPRQVDRS
jgi:hypothetical protein